MAQNVTVAGASYSDVPSVELPKTGGGTALFADPSITTAIASDVASGKQFLLADGSIGTGTASGGGGGGASNVVTGTFKGTTTGAAMTVDVPYTGTGYPIAVLVFPKNGFQDNEAIYSLVQRYAILTYLIVKRRQGQTPRYSTNTTYDGADILYFYKTNATQATAISSSGSSSTSLAYSTSSANSGSSERLKINSATKLSVFIASTSYGFAANIEYTYYVIYSS